MTSRRWAYLSLAAVALVGLTVVGILNSRRHDRALGEHDWGEAIQPSGSAIVNRIDVAVPFDAGRRRMAYYTGGNSSGSGERSAAPKRIIAEAVQGDVTVRMRAFDSYSRERASDEAAEVARIISLATTRVWPARPTAVEVDVHFMPDGAPFSLAKRVDWREGEPYEIAVFARDKNFDAGTAVHELYHALAIRWSRGTQDPGNRSRLNAALTYEEMAGDLFALCGRLLANESLTRETWHVPVVLDNRALEGPLNGDDLAAVLRLMSSDVPLSFAQAFRALLDPTITADVFGEQETIALESPQAERLLARCREFVPNPMLLGLRLAELVAEGQPEPRAPGN